MIPSDAKIIAQCSAKVLVLSTSADKPESWTDMRVREQAENVRPCTLFLLYQTDTVRLHLVDKAQGRVYFHFLYENVDYQVHTPTWHTVRLRDDRCYGLVFVEDEYFQKFLQAFSLICNQVKDVWDNDPYKSSISDSDDSMDIVHSHAIPTSQSLGKLGFSSPGRTLSVSPTGTPSPFSMQESSSSRIPSFPTIHRTGGTGELVQRLQEAIASGDVHNAKQISEVLAQRRTNLSMDVALDRPSRSQEVILRICVEDRETSRDQISLKVSPSMKISELKKRMLLDCGFIPEVQRWIIGKRMAKDDQTLYQCGVTVSGHIIYLYLITRASAGVTDEEFRRKYGHIVIMDGTRPKTTPNPSPALMTEPTRDPLVQRRLEKSILEPRPEKEPPPRKPIQPVVNRPKNIPNRDGWPCPLCTYVTLWTRDACGVCQGARPAGMTPPPDYFIPPEERRRLAEVDKMSKEIRESEDGRTVTPAQRETRFRNLVRADLGQDLIPNSEGFDCPVCFDTIPKGEGVVLRDCLHKCCRECLQSVVTNCDTGEAKCPYADDDFTCDSSLQHREVKGLVDEESFTTFLQRGVQIAESRAPNSYHCKTPDCQGWCIYEDAINMWKCDICRKQNCLTCKAIHEGRTCRQYQMQMEVLASTDRQAQKSKKLLERMLAQGEAMRCPSCDIIIQKKEGCDWVMCSLCTTEICWVTKGPRWGENGLGDTSGGCHCLEDGKTRCAPDCVNCH